MSEAVKKQYVGRAIEKTINGANGAFTIMKVSFGQKDLDAMQQHALENNGWVNLNINKKMSEPTEQNPSTHTISLDLWKPKGK